MSAILFWNAVALEANRISHTLNPGEQKGPTMSARALAIVHLAMYDAHAAVDTAAGGPYQIDLPPAPAGITAASAVAGAAATALLSLFPSQAEFFEAKIHEFGGREPGFHFGAEVARRLLAARQGDPSANATNYTPSRCPGRHRVDPDNPDQGFHGPFFGKARLFAATKRHTILPPPFKAAGGFDPDYLAAIRQVRGKGIAPELMGTLPGNLVPRTAEETMVGIYWGYDGAAGLGTPPRLYNQIVRKVAIKKVSEKASKEGDLARLFALVNVAMADAAILCWEEKYRYDFWRPVVAIREHDASLGPAASEPTNNLSNDADPSWRPLGAPATNSLATTFEVTTVAPFPGNQASHGRTQNFTPSFPAYPSGHATFGAAALHATRLFYKDAKPGKDSLFAGLDFVSDELDGVAQDNRGTVRPRHRRSFKDGLWEMIIENGMSRVFLGVHWVFDSFAVDSNGKPDLKQNVGGVPLGLAIAEDIVKTGMKQVPVPPCS